MATVAAPGPPVPLVAAASTAACRSLTCAAAQARGARRIAGGQRRLRRLSQAQAASLADGLLSGRLRGGALAHACLWLPVGLGVACRARYRGDDWQWQRGKVAGQDPQDPRMTSFPRQEIPFNDPSGNRRVRQAQQEAWHDYDEEDSRGRGKKEHHPTFDTRYFWDEQVEPTIGKGGLPRVRPPEPLPDPLPDMWVPPDQHEEDKEATPKVFSRVDPIIEDTNGELLEAPEMRLFAEAAETLGFPAILRAALVRKGFYEMSPVQRCGMPLLTQGKDVMAEAHAGSGKTAAYLLPTLTTLHQVSRLRPGEYVAAHYKTKGGERSSKPELGCVKGIRGGLAAIEFQLEGGLMKRQLILPEWVVGAPDAHARAPWTGPAMPKAVVLVPTRELCEQVQAEVEDFTCYSHLRSVALFGSPKLERQLRELAHGADLVVATPGRLIDIISRGVCKLDEVKHLVLDEVDRMVELGFGTQMEEIIQMSGMPTSSLGRQTSFWSATIPPSVKHLAEKLLGKECVRVNCTPRKGMSLSNLIEHRLIDARPYHRSLRSFAPGMEVKVAGQRRGVLDMQISSKRWRVKYNDGGLERFQVVKKGHLEMLSPFEEPIRQDRMNLLVQLLQRSEFEKAAVMVFCRQRETLKSLYKHMKTRFEDVGICHGGMDQATRSKSITRFRDGHVDLLLATDIAARGLDISRITHVINFELPLSLDEFVHRCGRVGRMGRRGQAVTFLTGREPLFRPLIRLLREHGETIPVTLRAGMRTQPWRHRHNVITRSQADWNPAPQRLDLRARARRRAEKLEALQQVGEQTALVAHAKAQGYEFAKAHGALDLEKELS